MPSQPPKPPRPAVNSEILDQLALMHEAAVSRDRANEDRFSAFHEELAMLRHQVTNGERATLPPVPKTSAQKLAGGALAGGRYGLLIIGALGLLSTAAKIWRPELVGPLDTLIQIFGGQ